MFLMPLFGPKKSPPFEPFKSKTYLKCAVARIKQETGGTALSLSLAPSRPRPRPRPRAHTHAVVLWRAAKKQNANKAFAKELGGLLREGKEEMARIKVEHLIRCVCLLLLLRGRVLMPVEPPRVLIRATNEIHGMEIVELFCDLLLARHMLIESEAQTQIAAGGRMNVSPPPELQEAIFSLCWAAGRAEIRELMEIAGQFKLLYPRAFNLDEYGQPLLALGPGGTKGAAQPVDYLPDKRVNQKLRDYFSVDVPPRQRVVDFLTVIGEQYAPEVRVPSLSHSHTHARARARAPTA